MWRREGKESAVVHQSAALSLGPALSCALTLTPWATDSLPHSLLLLKVLHTRGSTLHYNGEVLAQGHLSLLSVVLSVAW